MSKARELLARIIERNSQGYLDFCGMHTLKNEIIELLAQPEQEPVAYDYLDSLYYADDKDVVEHPIISRNGKPLYLAPSPRNQIPLTFDEISDIWKRLEASTFDEAIMSYARAIEKAHGIGVEINDT